MLKRYAVIFLSALCLSLPLSTAVSAHDGAHPHRDEYGPDHRYERVHHHQDGEHYHRPEHYGHYLGDAYHQQYERYYDRGRYGRGYYGESRYQRGECWRQRQVGLWHGEPAIISVRICQGHHGRIEIVEGSERLVHYRRGHDHYHRGHHRDRH